MAKMQSKEQQIINLKARLKAAQIEGAKLKTEALEKIIALHTNGDIIAACELFKTLIDIELKYSKIDIELNSECSAADVS
jgi:hypothetical protein